MAEKRAHPPDGLENGDYKRTRSNNGSPAPPASINGAHASSNTDIERQKAAAAEKIAALKARLAAQANKSATTSTAPSIRQSTAAEKEGASSDVAARIAAMKAKFAKPPSQAPASPALAASPAARVASPAVGSDGNRQAQSQSQTQTQIAALKAKIADRYAAPVPPQREDNSMLARGGMGVPLHPSLMGGLGGKTKEKERSTGRQKEPERAKVNPYLAQEAVADQEQKNDPNYDATLQKQRDRKARQLQFNQKGKFMAQAEDIRTKERIEKLKQELAERARKDALEQATEKQYLVPEPPAIEWWDEGLVNGTDYEGLDAPGKINYDAITEYVQHPILLEPPQEKNMPAAKPMYLTKKEQAKLRRQKRNEDHKEEQAKIRLGLKPPPPPKVKKSNLMRVLGQEAVKDPTAVEARVNREVAQRAEDHDVANEERKLTHEEKLAKIAAQQEADAARGVKVCVFKIDNLSYRKHRYQIDINAKQNALTGITILNPKMNLVIVEGGVHSIKAYKKLMLNRIRWTENSAPQGKEAVQKEDDHDWLYTLDETGQPKDLSTNTCVLVWEGDEKARAYKFWGSKVCETDGEAKEWLGRQKMENMWTLAQSM